MRLCRELLFGQAEWTGRTHRRCVYGVRPPRNATTRWIVIRKGTVVIGFIVLVIIILLLAALYWNLRSRRLRGTR